MISQKSSPQSLIDAEASQIFEDSIIKYMVKCYCTVTESSNFRLKHHQHFVWCVPYFAKGFVHLRFSLLIHSQLSSLRTLFYLAFREILLFVIGLEMAQKRRSVSSLIPKAKTKSSHTLPHKHHDPSSVVQL